jgi:hypothetical protein
MTLYMNDHADRFYECGGLPTLIRAMATHLSSGKIQCQACWALLTLAGSDEVARGIAASQGHIAVINALQAHR